MPLPSIEAQDEAWLENFKKDLGKITKEIAAELNELSPRNIRHEQETRYDRSRKKAEELPFSADGMFVNSKEYGVYILFSPLSYLNPKPSLNPEYIRAFKRSNFKWAILIYIIRERDKKIMFSSQVPVSRNETYNKRELERAKESILELIRANLR